MELFFFLFGFICLLFGVYFWNYFGAFGENIKTIDDLMLADFLSMLLMAIGMILMVFAMQK